jgi:hypothetical protein
MSQKQRKKLLAEQQLGSPPEQSFSKPVQSAWGNMTRTETAARQSFSLIDIMKQEMQQIRGAQSPPSSLTKGPQSPPSYLSTSPGLNPWQRGIENASRPVKEVTSDSSAVSFSDIVADERKQKENWSRMRAKPLQLTQVHIYS